MRDILFRGRRDNKDWVESKSIDVQLDGEVFLKKYATDHPYYSYYSWVKVDPSTVGQYTGLDDKNGTKIFEGDIVRVADPKGVCIPEEGEFIEAIYFKDGMWISAETENHWQDESIHRSASQGDWEYEVIGNLHDKA